MSDTPETLEENSENETSIDMSSSDGGQDLPPPPADGDNGGGGNRGVVTINIADEMRDSYRDYSMSVIIGRALPDVRDGLKPVHRRILYAMHDEGLLPSKKHSKCAGVVGEVLKKYHPHGDSAVYDALVRLAQPWNMSAPLIDGQGNFGSIDGDSAAAYRYTECRLENVAEELLRDIEKNTVDFLPNFDGSTEEPSVLPSRVPNLVVNGSEGIAVAMATRCPPHNLGETLDAITALVDEQHFGGEELDTKMLMTLMKGPDFPTGGIILGRGGIKSAFETGKGSIKMRGKCRVVDDEKRKRTQIIIDEVPFQLNKAKLVEKIADLVRDKKVEGIAEIRDESDRTGMRVAIDLKRDAVGEIVLNQLYKHTLLQTSFPVNQLAIVKGRPRTLAMRELLEIFLDFRREVVTRRTRYELDQAEKRFHLLAGLITALDDIDRIITIIRSSKNTEEARTRLCDEKFPNATKLALFTSGPTKQVKQWLEQGYAQLDQVQAQAILDMRLARLVALERDKLEAEGNELLVLIAKLTEILSDLKVLMKLIKNELIEIKEKYASPRRTVITDDIEDLSIEDLIADEEMVVTLSHKGYIKRAPLDTYRAQKRGGKGRTAAKMKDEDFVTDAFTASTHAYLMVLTNLGKVYWVKVHRLPDAGPTARGRPLVNLVQLQDDETVKAILAVKKYPENKGEQYIVTCTRKGTVKKTDLTQYSNVRASGLIACGIEEGDELIGARITNGSCDIMLTTKYGQSIRFFEEDVRPTGRPSTGVRGVALKRDDEVVSMAVVEDRPYVLTVTEKGYGKRTKIEEFRRQKRAGSGILAMKLTDKNGNVGGSIQVGDNDEVMVLTDGGTLIRVKAFDVSVYSRNTQGVRILNVGDSQKVISVSRIAEADDDDEQKSDGEAAAQEAASDGGAEASDASSSEAPAEGSSDAPADDNDES